MEIEIRSWDKYNPRRDQKNYLWLRLNNDLIVNPDLYALEPLEKLVWVLVLCEASKKNKARITLNLPWFCAHSKLEHDFIVASLRKLQKENLILIHDTELRSDPVVDETCTTPTNERYERTLRTNVTDESINLNKYFGPSLIVNSENINQEMKPLDVSSHFTDILKTLEGA